MALESWKHVGGVGLRILAPLAILAGGGVGMWRFTALKPPPEPPPAAKEATLRTRVAELRRQNYRVVVKTNAVVQPHNFVTLMPEISGTVTRVTKAFEVGAYFNEGQTLAEIDRRNYETAVAIAESRLAAAKSALKLAELNEQRKLRLIKPNAVSQAEVDAASATREQAEADFELAGTELKQAKLDLKRTTIKAPFDGRVQSQMVGVGQMAAPNTPLGEVFAVDFAEVRLPISAEQRRFLRLPEFPGDQTVKVTLTDALNEANDARWQATLVRTEGVLDEDSRDLFAIARVNDPFGRKALGPPLRIGQPVVALIQGEVLRDVIAIPRRAVRQLDQIVLVDQSSLTISEHTIAPLWADEKNLIVTAASLPRGKWLSTTALAYTPEGARVEIIPEPQPEAAVVGSRAGSTDASIAN